MSLALSLMGLTWYNHDAIRGAEPAPNEIAMASHPDATFLENKRKSSSTATTYSTIRGKKQPLIAPLVCMAVNRRSVLFVIGVTAVMLVSAQSTEHLQVGKEMDCSMEHAREHTYSNYEYKFTRNAISLCCFVTSSLVDLFPPTSTEL